MLEAHDAPGRPPEAYCQIAYTLTTGGEFGAPD
jgi:hypothetical protein